MSREFRQRKRKRVPNTTLNQDDYTRPKEEQILKLFSNKSKNHFLVFFPWTRAQAIILGLEISSKKIREGRALRSTHGLIWHFAKVSSNLSTITNCLKLIKACQ